jgi:[ribosomal protein S18]-alanine N-acetyltransferase
MRTTFGEAMQNRIGLIRRRNDMAVPSGDFVIRPLDRDDAVVLAALELRCVGAARWRDAGYREIGTGGIAGWAAVREGTILGFVLARAVADEMEILNLAVDPDARRQGIAARLVARAVEEVRRADVKRVYLEVRESNSTARAFYLSTGFAEQGRRKNYYSQPSEDALVLVLRLD